MASVQYGYYAVHGSSHIVMRSIDGSRWDKLGEVQKEEDARMIVEALNGTLTLTVPDSMHGLDEK